MSDAQERVFDAARRDRKAAALLAREMLRTVASEPQFKPGLLAAVRPVATPTETAAIFSKLYAENGVASDAKALRDLADVCGLHRLTWADIDGN